MVFPSDSEATVWDVAPEDYIATLGETKTIYVMWGHPYEHISFNMASAPEISVTKPDGTVEQLTPEQITVTGQHEDGTAGEFTAYKASFTVDQDGDSIVLAKYDDPDEDLIDYCKIVIHCGEETWYGWDTEVATKQTEVIPYVRPYGMEEGFVFSGNAKYKGKVLQGATVEIEQYHTLELGKEIVEIAEKKFSYDPPMVFTRQTTTNQNGDFSYTLDEPGIWFVCAAKESDTGGRTIRGVFIVPVLEAFPPVEEQSTPSISTAELQRAVDEAKQAAADAKGAAEGAASTPGFGIILSVIGILGALLFTTRKG
ncbi:MAG: DUF4198 domain-containing protein [Methanosarcinales archaeon]|uniref:DUF4198 domain-containing protein n=1 Tax=Candidatus Ethanoperedens thermophilum TaxID=2766897 RepID=A0A848DBH0_9EURY|nr:DUF4198 domain-containing protein [Candidatus Ethanoperedens thermophilum]